MIIGFVLLAVFGLAVGAALLMRSGGDSTSDKDLGSVSSSWLSEHRSGRQ